jgi:hypothetical protein
MDGWKAPIKFYRFKCKRHGWVVDYAHGFNARLYCPICQHEDLRALEVSRVGPAELAIAPPEINHVVLGVEVKADE